MKWEQESYLGNRFEFKYILEPAQAHQLQNYIEKVGLELDNKCVDGPYTVNSLYFETPFLDDYYDKDSSLLVRKKMRARMYEESWQGSLDNVWLEIKNKRNFQIKKDRVRVAMDDWRMFEERQDPLLFIPHADTEEEKQVLRHFSYLFLKGRYHPYVIVKYKRTAYLDSFTSKIRVTFDSDLNTCFAHDEMQDHFMTPVNFRGTIMEVKFNDKLPWWFTKATELFHIRRSDFSKYVRSLVTLRNSYRIPVSR